MKLKLFLKKINIRLGTALNWLKKIPSMKGVKLLKDRFALNTRGRVSKKLLFVILAVIILICIIFALVYYFYFYLKPNFANLSSNYVSSSTPGTISPGEDITYDIFYINNGYRSVDSLKIIIKVPEYTNFTGSTSEYSIEEDNSEIVFEVENILVNDSGTFNFTITTDHPLDNGTAITIGDIEFIYKIGDRQFEHTIASPTNHTIESNPIFKDLKIESRDSTGGHLYMGDELEYTVKIKNDGDMDATGFELKANVATDTLTIVESSINTGGELADSGQVVWKTGTFKAGDVKTFRFKVKVNEGLSDGDVIETLFTLNCDQDIQMRESTYDEIRAFPDFSTSDVTIADSNGGSLWAGETVDIKILVKNSGQNEAKNYQLYCPTPEGATYISNSGTSEGISWSDDIRGLIWDLERLAPGEEKEINFKIKVNDNLYYKGGTITTDFKIESEGQEFVLESESININKHIYMTIVAMGDSLIAKSDWVQRLDNLLESTYPIADYNTIASGVPGELASQGYYRFDSSVAVHRPQIVIISYGTNDTGTGLNNFRFHMEGIVNKARNLGETVFLTTVGPVNYPGKDDWPKYNQVVLDMANKYSLPVINIVSPLSQNTRKYIYDGIHYTPEGSALVAQIAFNTITPYLNSLGQRR